MIVTTYKHTFKESKSKSLKTNIIWPALVSLTLVLGAIFYQPIYAKIIGTTPAPTSASEPEVVKPTITTNHCQAIFDALESIDGTIAVLSAEWRELTTEHADIQKSVHAIKRQIDGMPAATYTRKHSYISRVKKHFKQINIELDETAEEAAYSRCVDLAAAGRILKENALRHFISRQAQMNSVASQINIRIEQINAHEQEQKALFGQLEDLKNSVNIQETI